ncbi:tRNA (adenosine(37)-N6)-threonylcarbamoyltransferase complex dimerization subunit type 1 TsaB [Branchiibius sp. NY16-3462-2]|uniref:tRNA (adenosine(37)-N6)-threonylcarbamoyltransferase complex dimerization subunit type 1 TsaB n=1 Tax=Branchiibius sp. NY16-3462-2 TaxID=1807500 RepID=UPI00079AE86E|nr:tRNA (adenosine(37)-N6)-threonylcarbamoyltransferase complex dimerization subunit type 1 TsaB [Branchiibius sp. NY16-3462-2]KYH45307.1 hypothetical protein AZH51_05380 [Branchiibius sp. NY16-3462-2]
MLLALDTATNAVTAAVHDGTRVVASHSVIDARRHAEILMPVIDQVMTGIPKSALTQIAVGVGPGPYTGLRVGVMTALTLGHALDIPVVGLCSLDALAAAVALDEFAVATDARRKEVYWAVYSQGVRRSAPSVSLPGELPIDVRELPTAGRGPLLYPADLVNGIEPLDVDAGWLATEVIRRQGAGEPLDEVRPLYLRQPDAKPSSGVKSVLGS